MVFRFVILEMRMRSLRTAKTDEMGLSAGSPELLFVVYVIGSFFSCADSFMFADLHLY